MNIQFNKFDCSKHQLRMPEIILTEDGSHTLYVKELDGHYHSIYGAIAESWHVFIKAGLLSVKKKHINIFSS